MQLLGKPWHWLASVGMVGLVATAACSDDDGGEASADESAADEATADEAAADSPYEDHTSDTYGGTDNWICHPDLGEDECRDLSATEIAPDGSQRPADLELAADPAIDCFYVYPTVSYDPGPNSDLMVDDAERLTVGAQAAPFASTCRVFAPAYRQLTLSAIGSGDFGDETARETAYGDVVDAWKSYISQHNDGRGVVLIGHSQGAGVLNRLIAEEIDAQPELRERLVSAILLGGTVDVPDGEDVGGSFQNVPACRAMDQVGCVISFSSYAAGSPPPESAIFGRSREGAGNRALCVDPVELAGGNGLADAIVPTEAPLIASLPEGTFPVDTRYVVLPEALAAGCEQSGVYDYFAAAPASPDDARPVATLLEQRLGPDWGLHLQDAQLAMGDLLEIVATQAESFTAN